MPVTKLKPDETPPGFKPITPDGFTPIPSNAQENMVDVTGRAALGLMPGSQGPGGPSLGEELRGEIHKVGQSAENHLTTMYKLLDIIGRQGQKPNANPTFQGQPLPPNQPSDARALAQATLSKRTGRMALETAGGIAATLPFGGEGGALPFIGRMGASAVGAGVGSLASESFDPTKSPLMSAGAAALTNGAAQGVGDLFLAGLSGTKLEAGAARAYEAITARGGKIPPGHLSKSGFVDTLQGIAGASMGGGPIIGNVRQGAENIATDMVREFVDQYSKGATKADTGELLNSAIQNSKAAFDQVMDTGFRAADQVVGQAAVSTLPLKQLAASIAVDATKKVAGSGAGELKIVNDILSRPDTIPFADAQILRKSLRDLTPGAEDMTTRGGVEATAERLNGVLGKQMDDAAKASMSPAGYAYFKSFNEAYAKGSKVFNSKLIEAVAKKDPEAFYNYAIKNNNAYNVKVLRDTVNSEAAWEPIQAQISTDLVNKATNADGRIDGATLANSIKPGGNFGEEKFVAAFGREGYDNFKELARTLEITQGAGAKRTPGAIAIQIMQGTQMTQALTGGWFVGAGKPLTGATIFLAPAAVAKMITLKPVIKALTVGLRMPAGSKAMTNAFSHFAAQAARYGLIGGPDSLGTIMGQAVQPQPGQQMSLPPGTVTRLP